MEKICREEQSHSMHKVLMSNREEEEGYFGHSFSQLSSDQPNLSIHHPSSEFGRQRYQTQQQYVSVVK